MAILPLCDEHADHQEFILCGGSESRKYVDLSLRFTTQISNFKQSDLSKAPSFNLHCEDDFTQNRVFSLGPRTLAVQGIKALHKFTEEGGAVAYDQALGEEKIPI